MNSNSGRLRDARTSEALVHGLLEAAREAIVITDKDGHILLINAHVEKVFGHGRDDLLGGKIQMLFPEDLRARCLVHWTEYFATPAVRRGARTPASLFGLRKDSTQFAIEVSLTPIETPGGTLVAVAICDVSEAGHSESLANMGHDLRTPLNAIMGFADLMYQGKAGPVSDTHREYLGDILTSSRHLLHLLNEMFDPARVESSKVASCAEPGEERDESTSWTVLPPARPEHHGG